MPGTKLGPYELLEEVGRGGMASVYRAHQASVGRDVAIKVITQGLGGDGQAVQRFQREARLIARLEHPHILPVYDFDGTSEPPYIVMRYMDGGSLKEAIQSQMLPVEEVIYLLRQVASALDYAHRQGVVHRDVKPSNILIDQDGNAFVVDFGIARIAGGNSGLTGSGSMVGTPDYMSPEQIRGEDDIDHRADIYALGVIAFQMVSGRLPFQADNAMSVLLQHMNQPVPRSTQLNPRLPLGVDEVFSRVMAKDRQNRYPTASSFVAALTRALGSSAAAVPTNLQSVAQSSLLQRRLSQKERPSTGSQTTPVEQNKPVTVYYANAVEYAELLEEARGAEAAREWMVKLWGTAENYILARGGRVLESSERDILALWGVENALENDPEQAVFAALELQQYLRQQISELNLLESYEQDLPLSIGIHTGMALLVRDRTTGTVTASGATISLTERLSQHSPGSLSITRDLFRAVQGVFTIREDQPLRLRGRKEPVEVYQVVAAKPRRFYLQERGIEGVETRLIGRDAQLKQMQYAYLDALEECETHMVTLLSEAGLGKSRLLSEFNQWAELRVEKFRIFRGRATPAMTNRPYALLRDLVSFRFEIFDNDSPPVVREKLENGVRQLVGADEEMAHLIGYLCGFDMSASPYVIGLVGDPQQLGNRARQLCLRLFEKLGKRQMAVVELEDAHYADDATLDLWFSLVNEHPNLPLLIIIVARPALVQRRPAWVSPQRFHQVIHLEPLGRRESRELVAEILKKAAEVPKDLRDLLVEHGEGNPLYIEELVKMLLEDRVVIKESEDVWRVEASRVGSLCVPPTLVGVLQARFDSLVYPERVVLQRASVVGRLFYDSAVSALDGSDELILANDLPQLLANLEERGFINHRSDSAFAGSREYLFSQSMQRDQIYDTLLERQRMAYHAGVAGWIAKAAGERAGEYNLIIANHYEHAGQREQAALYLQKAGEQALALNAFTIAADLLQRAIDLTPPEAYVRLASAGLALADTRIKQGDFASAMVTLERVLDLARSLGDPAVQAEALYLLSQIDTQRGDWEAAKARLARALPLARQAGGGTALVWTLYGLADTHFRSGNFDTAQGYAEDALALAQQTSNKTAERMITNRLATILTFLSTPGDAEFERARVLLENLSKQALEAGDRMVASAALTNLGTLSWESNDSNLYMRYTNEALALSREIDHPLGIIITGSNLAGEYSVRGQLDQAHTLVVEIIQRSLDIGSESLLVSSMAYAAYYYIARGDVQYGLRLLGMVKTHPASSSDITSEMPRMLASLMGSLMTPAEVEAALETGEGLDAHTVVDEVMKDLQNPAHKQDKRVESSA